MKIGLFDSGVGGTSVLDSIKKILPNEEYKYIADSKNCPYGEKSDAELKAIVDKNVKTLIDWGAKIIVVACNTATTRCIEYLRNRYPDILFVGTEPAIKLAANTDAQLVLVMATPGTIESERTKVLLRENQKTDQEVRLLPCLGLADTIEKNYQTGNFEVISKYLDELFATTNYSPEVIVLGCTHYSLIKELIQAHFKDAKLIDGNGGVAKRVKNLVEKLTINQ